MKIHICSIIKLFPFLNENFLLLHILPCKKRRQRERWRKIKVLKAFHNNFSHRNVKKISANFWEKKSKGRKTLPIIDECSWANICDFRVAEEHGRELEMEYWSTCARLEFAHWIQAESWVTSCRLRRCWRMENFQFQPRLLEMIIAVLKATGQFHHRVSRKWKLMK